jgi:hypothetical protein
MSGRSANLLLNKLPSQNRSIFMLYTRPLTTDDPTAHYLIDDANLYWISQSVFNSKAVETFSDQR